MNHIIMFMFYFILLFLLLYIIEIVFIDKKKKSLSKLKKNDEILLFIKKYNLDMNKSDFKEVKRTVYFINCFIISFSASLILNIKNTFIQAIVCFIVVFTLIYSLFEIFGRKLKNKERLKDIN